MLLWEDNKMKKCISGLRIIDITHYVRLKIVTSPINIDKIVKEKVIGIELKSLNKYGNNTTTVLMVIKEKINSCQHCKMELRIISAYIETSVRNGYCMLSSLFEKDIEIYSSWSYMNSINAISHIKILRQKIEKFGKADTDIQKYFESRLRLCEHCINIQNATIVSLSNQIGVQGNN